MNITDLKKPHKLIGGLPHKNASELCEALKRNGLKAELDQSGETFNVFVEEDDLEKNVEVPLSFVCGGGRIRDLKKTISE
jgi:hypothetical protein